MPRAVSAALPSSTHWRGIGVGAMLTVVVAVGAWWFWPGTPLVPETAALARELLDTGGTADRQALRRVMTNVDRMTREQITQLWRSVGEEWRRLRQQAVDRYFLAPAVEKPRLLDDEIARLAALRDLTIALHPDANSDQPPRLPQEILRSPDRAREPADPTARRAEADRRAVIKRYEEALAAHAKSRGVRLPQIR
ncbi:MAG: hypothetical protein FJ286_11480 [Planctomycetes bacterium]|nr:hypothetical protein [Planctomycetota bacterium]